MTELISSENIPFRDMVVEDVTARIQDLPGWTPELAVKLEKRWKELLAATPRFVGGSASIPIHEGHCVSPNSSLAITSQSKPARTWPGPFSDHFGVSGNHFFGLDADMVAAYANGSVDDLVRNGPASYRGPNCKSTSLQIQLKESGGLQQETLVTLASHNIEETPPNPPIEVSLNREDTSTERDLTVKSDSREDLSVLHEYLSSISSSKKRKKIKTQDGVVEISDSTRPVENGGNSDSDSDYGEDEQRRRKSIRRVYKLENSEAYQRETEALERDPEIFAMLQPLNVEEKIYSTDAQIISGWVKSIKSSSNHKDDATWRVKLQGVFARVNKCEVFLPSCNCELSFN
mmetsp:Transcript_2609/g.6086  ORF Transcript_2609/g.6086 Transcript_2609/m.6086 type:complete len:346 (+) Transcript_2609:222-1259(+)